MITDITIKLHPKEASDNNIILNAVARKAKIKLTSVNDFRVVKRSIDARKKQITVNLTVKIAVGVDEKLKASYKPKEFKNVDDAGNCLIIVGAGPAGLFAALRAIELGIKPIVIERGKDVESRRLDIVRLCRDGIVDSDSNYCFGEGGAGAYSDGKLFTRSKKRGNTKEILELLHQHGASESVLTDSHPHIGSDKLPQVIKNIRETIISHGGEVKFETKAVRLLVDNNKCKGLVTDNGEIYSGEVILATGHSARDVYYFLKEAGVKMEAKGFAMGVRLEHPQSLIDKLQYHTKEGRGKYLPAAEYSFVTQVDGRGVYSFCMCPGGVVVPAASSPGESVVNGMSASARAGAKANSGMVVQILPEDFPDYAEFGEFRLLEMQKDIERNFYQLSDNTINAPAQRMLDFVKGKESKTLPDTTYLPNIYTARLDEMLPYHIANRLQIGFKEFDRKCPGFLTNEAVLIGLESRTSSPVRVPRDNETMQHIEIEGLYPAGEGAGYAGGIVSAAIDGRRCVDAYALKCGILKGDDKN